MPRLMEKRRNSDGSLDAIYDDGSVREIQASCKAAIDVRFRRSRKQLMSGDNVVPRRQSGERA